MVDMTSSRWSLENRYGWYGYWSDGVGGGGCRWGGQHHQPVSASGGQHCHLLPGAGTAPLHGSPPAPKTAYAGYATWVMVLPLSPPVSSCLHLPLPLPVLSSPLLFLLLFTSSPLLPLRKDYAVFQSFLKVSVQRLLKLDYLLHFLLSHDVVCVCACVCVCVCKCGCKNMRI